MGVESILLRSIAIMEQLKKYRNYSDSPAAEEWEV